MESQNTASSPRDSSLLFYFSSQQFSNEISAHAEHWSTALLQARVLCLALASLEDISLAAKINLHARSLPLGARAGARLEHHVG